MRHHTQVCVTKAYASATRRLAGSERRVLSASVVLAVASRLHCGGGEQRSAAAPIDAKARSGNRARGGHMAESVYKIIELVGTSPESWEKAASAAVAQAAKSLRDPRIAEVSQLDLAIEDGKVKSYRAKVKLSFKLENRG